MADIEIEIDGKKLTAKPNQTVIQVADDAGIYIPRFCYHKHLSIAANCRMCLVEVEKSPKTVPACATPVMAGMKVFTKSAKTIEAQRAVMEFLLINHPLDCPICDQGGECELQDLAMGYGSDHSNYDECKRSIADENIGPLISTDMTRCIYCTRCVRFGAEVAGMRELGGTYRGEHTEIGTFVKHAIHSEVSGNVIDLCPVGALTSKPYRFRARAWELDQAPSIAPHDCLGTNVFVHTRYGKVMRVVSRENKTINETWIADRDRYSYAGLYHDDRLEEPMQKINGVWQAIDWRTAFEVATSKLHEVLAEHGSDKLGALASPNATLEEFYLLQKIVRGLGSPHIDHRLREIDTSDQAAMGAFPGLNMAIADIEQADAILVIGSNIQKEIPLISLRIRKAMQNGAKIVAINPLDYAFNFDLTAKKITANLSEALASVANAFHAEFADVAVDAEAIAIADVLRDKQKVCILVGALAHHDQHAANIRFIAQKIAAATKGKVALLTDGANSAGAWLAGAIPHRHAGGVAINEVGFSAYGMLEKPRKAYILLNVEPELDCANAALACSAMTQAKFVLALSMYRNPILEQHADLILPIAPFTETSGTYVNATGEWQSFTGVAKTYQSVRPAWKVLRVLGNFLHLEGFGYESSEEIKHEVKALVEKMPTSSMQFTQPANFNLQTNKSRLTRIGEVPIYALDSLVRRSKPLQETQVIIEGDLAAVRIHPNTAATLHLQAGDQVRVRQAHAETQLPWIVDTRIAEGAAWIPAGIEASATLGDIMGEVEITKC